VSFFPSLSLDLHFFCGTTTPPGTTTLSISLFFRVGFSILHMAISCISLSRFTGEGFTRGVGSHNAASYPRRSPSLRDVRGLLFKRASGVLAFQCLVSMAPSIKAPSYNQPPPHPPPPPPPPPPPLKPYLSGFFFVMLTEIF